MNRVALCMICKNEILNLEKLLRVVLPILEEVHVTDTGSTDGTLEMLARLKVDFRNLFIHHFDWVDDFSAARNFSFSKAGDVDWILWLDSDDMVDPVQLSSFKSKELLQENVGAWLLPYNYYRSADGTPLLVLDRERFVRKSLNPRWLDPIHECIDISSMKKAYSSAVVVEHLRDQIGKKFDPSRNIRILKKCYESGNPSARITYYYGKELFGAMDPEGIKVLERYLTVPGRYWDDEVNARSKLAQHYLSVKKHGDAIRVINEVYHLDSTRNRVEFYYVYGMVEKDLGNHEQAIFWLKRCLVDPPKEGRVLYLDVFTWKPAKAIAECYAFLNNRKEAAIWADKALSYLPSDAAMKDWWNLICRLEPKSSPKSGLKVLKLSSNQLRQDSLLSDHTFFADASFDGVVVDELFWSSHQDEIDRVLKPGGFLWYKDFSAHASSRWFKNYGCLGPAAFNGVRVMNFIKPKPGLPSFWFDGYDPIKVSPSASERLRIHAFARSAIKAGFPISGTPDFLISTRISPDSPPAKTKVLELTEKLPGYKAYGIDQADVVNCSSPLLAEHVRNFTKAKVICVEDPFDSTQEFWL